MTKSSTKICNMKFWVLVKTLLGGCCCFPLMSKNKTFYYIKHLFQKSTHTNNNGDDNGQTGQNLTMGAPPKKTNLSKIIGDYW